VTNCFHGVNIQEGGRLSSLLWCKEKKKGDKKGIDIPAKKARRLGAEASYLVRQGRKGMQKGKSGGEPGYEHMGRGQRTNLIGGGK